MIGLYGHARLSLYITICPPKADIRWIPYIFWVQILLQIPINVTMPNHYWSVERRLLTTLP